MGVIYPKRWERGNNTWMGDFGWKIQTYHMMYSLFFAKSCVILRVWVEFSLVCL